MMKSQWRCRLVTTVIGVAVLSSASEQRAGVTRSADSATKYCHHRITSFLYPIPLVEVFISSGGRILTAVDLFGNISLRKIGASRDEWRLPTGPAVAAVAFAPNGKVVALASDTSTLVHVWDISQARQAKRKSARFVIKHDSQVQAVAFSQNGKLLATASADGVVNIWQVSTGRKLRTFKTRIEFLMAVQFNACGTVVAAGGVDNRIKLLHLVTGEIEALRIFPKKWVVYNIEFSPDGTYVAFTGALPLGRASDTISIWKLSKHKATFHMELKTGDAVSCVRFHKKSNLLAVGYNKTIRVREDSSVYVNEVALVYVWDLRSAKIVANLPTGLSGSFTSLRFSPDLRLLAASSVDGVVHTWELKGAKR